MSVAVGTTPILATAILQKGSYGLTFARYLPHPNLNETDFSMFQDTMNFQNTSLLESYLAIGQGKDLVHCSIPMPWRLAEEMLNASYSVHPQSLRFHQVDYPSRSRFVIDHGMDIAVESARYLADPHTRTDTIPSNVWLAKRTEWIAQHAYRGMEWRTDVDIFLLHGVQADAKFDELFVCVPKGVDPEDVAYLRVTWPGGRLESEHRARLDLIGKQKDALLSASFG